MNERYVISVILVSSFILGFIPAIQVFPQLVFLGGGLLTVCAIPENRLSLHLLGAAGEFNRSQQIPERVHNGTLYE